MKTFIAGIAGGVGFRLAWPLTAACDQVDGLCRLPEQGERLAAAGLWGAWIVFEDEAGFSMTPSRARTWGRRGHTPVIRVRGRSRRRTSVDALCPAA